MKKTGWILGGVGCLVFAGCAGLGVLAFHNAATFRCRSIQSEAKTNLSGIFITEKAFQGEYGFYTSDLVALNWEPDGSPLYVYGFANPGPGITTKEARAAKLDDYDES